MKRMLQGSAEARDWWRVRVKKTETPFFAKTDSRLPPTSVDMSLPQAKVFSVVLERGDRHYCFDNQKDRDRFLTKYRKVFGAVAVGKDPCP